MAFDRSGSGGVDIVLDDGSHRMPHVHASFEALFPWLEAGGVYVVDNLHTAYRPKSGGDNRSFENLFRFVRELTDDMRRRDHPGKQRHEGPGDAIPGLHFHESIAVIEKQPVHRPCHSWGGQ